MRIAYFDTFSGISGDMTIGAFLDLGVPLSVLEEGLAPLGLDEVTLEERLGDYLSPREIRRTLERRDALVAHIQALIDLKGAGGVLLRR